jgi:hypothetical protein
MESSGSRILHFFPLSKTTITTNNNLTCERPQLEYKHSLDRLGQFMLAQNPCLFQQDFFAHAQFTVKFKGGTLLLKGISPKNLTTFHEISKH